MSRMYRIAVSESVSRVVHVEDGVETTLDILPVLPQEQMGALLADELARRGFSAVAGDSAVEGAGTMVRVESDGTVIEVNVATGKVNVSLAEDVAVNVEAATDITGDEDYGGPTEEMRQRAKESLRGRLEQDVERQQEEKRATVTRRLEAKLGDLKKELDGVVNGVTAAGLKQRAAQLGEVESVEENASGELTIRVKV